MFLPNLPILIYVIKRNNMNNFINGIITIALVIVIFALWFGVGELLIYAGMPADLAINWPFILVGLAVLAYIFIVPFID